jgi:outer membrane immunogenic protein
VRKLEILAVLCIATGSTAAAAAEPSSWTGFNVGASVGFKSISNDWNTTELLARELGPAALGPFGLDPSDFDLNASSMRQHDYEQNSPQIGIFGGYDYQIGNSFVVGVLGDFSADFGSAQTAYIPGTANLLRGGPGAVPTDDSVKISSDWDLSLRARAGILVEPGTLLFASAGWAGQERTIKVDCTLTTTANTWCSNTGNQKTDSSETLSGWTVGVGVESLIGAHWSVRAEYRYADFGRDSETILTGGDPTPNGDAVRADIETTAHIVNIGIAYRF